MLNDIINGFKIIKVKQINYNNIIVIGYNSDHPINKFVSWYYNIDLNSYNLGYYTNSVIDVINKYHDRINKR